MLANLGKLREIRSGTGEGGKNKTGREKFLKRRSSGKSEGKANPG